VTVTVNLREDSLAQLSGVFIVTGAASGIGRASALHFADCGGLVVAVDINAEGLATIASDSIHVERADITNSAECKRVSEKASSLGKVAGLFNCAGLEIHGTVVTMPEEDWNRVIAVNLTAIFLMSKHAIPHMEAAGGGAIVNMSSVQAHATQPDVAAYTATKGAVISITRVMAIDHGRKNIRVNAICPGTIETPLAQAVARMYNPKDPSAKFAEWGGKHALGRIGQPIEVARLAAFLLSSDASFITGSFHLVDGGMLAML
jgi:NAD(P)-dependent dehydrogenase (short-subunit alcohol dehydrogenase family)